MTAGPANAVSAGFTGADKKKKKEKKAAVANQRQPASQLAS